MGRHDADPAGRGRHAGLLVVCLVVLALLAVGAYALQALSHG